MRGVLVNIARIIVSLTFIFSGFVKVVDPLGTVYKFQDYAEAVGLAGVFPDWLLTCAAIVLALTEFSLGISILFAIRRKVTTWFALVFMAVMTIITVDIHSQPRKRLRMLRRCPDTDKRRDAAEEHSADGTDDTNGDMAREDATTDKSLKQMVSVALLVHIHSDCGGIFAVLPAAV